MENSTCRNAQIDVMRGVAMLHDYLRPLLHSWTQSCSDTKYAMRIVYREHTRNDKL